MPKMIKCYKSYRSNNGTDTKCHYRPALSEALCLGTVVSLICYGYVSMQHCACEQIK